MFQEDKTVNHDVTGSASHRSPSCVVLRQLDTLASTLLALLATPLDKTIFNRFICINPAGEPEKALARAGAFFNELDLRCMKNEAAFSYEAWLRHTEKLVCDSLHGSFVECFGRKIKADRIRQFMMES